MNLLDLYREACAAYDATLIFGEPSKKMRDALKEKGWQISNTISEKCPTVQQKMRYSTYLVSDVTSPDGRKLAGDPEVAELYRQVRKNTARELNGLTSLALKMG
jgi:hypothetical protein